MTLPTLFSWPDFDGEGELNGATIIGGGDDCETLALVLDSPHHDAFLRLALASPDLLETLEYARDRLETCNYEGDEDEALERINTAIAKAKGG